MQKESVVDQNGLFLLPELLEVHEGSEYLGNISFSEVTVGKPRGLVQLDWLQGEVQFLQCLKSASVEGLEFE
jgi:hypothetical protein